MQDPGYFGPELGVEKKKRLVIIFPLTPWYHSGQNDYNCVGCDIVQADHAPEAGVAQGIFHGILVRHHGGNQEEVEEGLENEVERHKEDEDTQATKHKCACR